MPCKQVNAAPHIQRLQQERNQLLGDLDELRTDLSLVQSLIRDKQKKLRHLNQDIALKTRRTATWQLIQQPQNPQLSLNKSMLKTSNPSQATTLTCLPGGKRAKAS